MESMPRKAEEFFQRLDEAGIDWVLVGAAAMNHYLPRPRATLDVDVVVRKKHLAKAKRVLDEQCTDVRETEVHFHGTLSPDPSRLEVDVIKSQSHDLFGIALDRKSRLGGVSIVPVEVFLALKYLSIVSVWRSRDDKGQDVLDFMKTYKANRIRVDRARLLDLASRAHAGAKVEFPVFLDAVENDKPITI